MKAKSARIFPTPDDASTAFYDAFERADLQGMMVVWAETDSVVCIHPRGPRLVGFDAVRDSWAQIFAAGGRLRVATTDACIFEGQSIAVQTVVEMVSAQGSADEPTPVCATNVFELTEGGWRLVIHHASPMTVPEAPDPEEEDAAQGHVLH